MTKQDWQTPPSFVEAVVRRYGAISTDLAARPDNAVALQWVTPEVDSLTQDWSALAAAGVARGEPVLWLNPPYANLEPWAAKARGTELHGGLLVMLTLAATGAGWFVRHVFRRARVVFLRGRLRFVGADDDYPKDLMLSVFGLPPGFEVWSWRPPKEKDPCTPKPRRTPALAAAAHSAIPTSPPPPVEPSAPSGALELTTR